MAEFAYIHYCPNGCRNATFCTVAHVAQDWEVNELGDFISEVETGETVAPPNNDNTWTCMKCGEEAPALECRVFRDIVGLYIDDDGDEVCDKFDCYIEAHPKAGNNPRVFVRWHSRAGFEQAATFLCHNAENAVYAGGRIIITATGEVI